jgi:hypothetical protein
MNNNNVSIEDLETVLNDYVDETIKENPHLTPSEILDVQGVLNYVELTRKDLK